MVAASRMSTNNGMQATVRRHTVSAALPRMVLLLVSVVLLTGCATGAASAWSKPNSSEMDLKRDQFACSQESRVGSVAGTDETRIFFYGQNRLAQVEANRLYRMCMEARGWSTVEPR